MDTVVDRKLPGYRYSASIFIKVIGCEIYHGSSNDLYLCCQMNFASNVVQNEAPQFVDLELLDVNTSNEFGILGTPAMRIRSSVGFIFLPL